MRGVLVTCQSQRQFHVSIALQNILQRPCVVNFVPYRGISLVTVDFLHVSMHCRIFCKEHYALQNILQRPCVVNFVPYRGISLVTVDFLHVSMHCRIFCSGSIMPQQLKCLRLVNLNYITYAFTPYKHVQCTPLKLLI
jgi:hypothetical protein